MKLAIKKTAIFRVLNSLIEDRLVTIWNCTAETPFSYRAKRCFFVAFSFFFLLALFIYSQKALIPKKDKISVYSRLEMKQIVANLHVRLSNYENISFQFIANQELNNMLENYANIADPYEVSLISQKFSHFLEGYSFFDQVIHDAVYIDINNPKRKALTMGETVSNEFIQTFRRSEEYNEIIQAGGKTVWLRPARISSAKDYYLILGRRINHLYSGDALGILLLFLKEKYLDYSINDCLYNDGHSFSGKLKSDYFLLIDGEGTILSTPFKQQITEDVSFALSGLKVSKLNTRVDFTCQAHDRTVLVINQPVEHAGWFLLNVIPVSPTIIGKARLIHFIQALSWLVFISIEIFLFLSGLAIYKTLFRTPLLLNSNHSANKPKWLKKLNEREKQILSLMAQGYDNREIAKRIHVAEQTVKNNISAIYGKLQVSGRVQASLKAIEAGLTDKENGEKSAMEIKAGRFDTPRRIR
jgi:DNA-binding CsgD family transcriptional regulator